MPRSWPPSAVVVRRGLKIRYFRTSPRMETGDARYAWVNTSLFVGEGRVIEGLGVEYRVARVT